MIRRVQRIAAKVSPRHARLAQGGFPWAGTFHSVGARLLREFAGRIGLDPAFTIHDREDSGDLMNLVRHELGLSAKGKRFPSRAPASPSIRRRSTPRPPSPKSCKPASLVRRLGQELRDLFLAYVEAKQAQQVLDYDDLLLYWAQMVAEPELAREVGARFSHILVDEFQDTNRLQAGLLLAMRPDGRGLTVVGDDAQSIYSFRGATVRNILDFPGQFSTPARRITLDRNYRSTQPILAAANAVIAQAKERFSKDLWSERISGENPGSCHCATSPTRPRGWSIRCWPAAKPGSGSRPRRCCSAPPTTACASRSSSPGATSPS
jgi:DNA helicase-2/ATP-dependent DNA helicase PcrA